MGSSCITYISTIPLREEGHEIFYFSGLEYGFAICRCRFCFTCWCSGSLSLVLGVTFSTGVGQMGKASSVQLLASR